LPDSESLLRFAEVARVLTGSPTASVADGIAFVEDLARALSVPGFASYGMQRADIPGIVAKATQASSMKGNPITLTAAELSEVLERAL